MPDPSGVSSGLRQDGCPLCGHVMDPEGEGVVHHYRLGYVHEKCAQDIRWTNLKGGRDPRAFEKDIGDLGESLTDD